MHTHPTPPSRESAETLPQYAARVLGYALRHGLDDLDLEQLEQADQAAQRSVAALPMKLDCDQSRLDDTLHALRHRISKTIKERRSARAQLARMLQDLYPPQDEQDAQPQEDGTPEDDATRAARLLRAALTLIMQPPGGQDGGHGARLIKPKPTLPAGGIALPRPAQAAPVTPAAAPRAPRF